MAGQLIQVATETVTSAVSSVDLSGVNTDDVYMIAFNNVTPTTDATIMYARIIKTDDSADSTSNYDRAFKVLRTDQAFTNGADQNQDSFGVEQLGTGTGESANGIMYLYNFNNSSEYNFVSFEFSNFDSAGKLIAGAGGFVHTVAQQSKGISFYIPSNTIAGGTFTLYKVV